MNIVGCVFKQMWSTLCYLLKIILNLDLSSDDTVDLSSDSEPEPESRDDPDFVVEDEDDDEDEEVAILKVKVAKLEK